jgi:hypothetical protein
MLASKRLCTTTDERPHPDVPGFPFQAEDTIRRIDWWPSGVIGFYHNEV